MLQVGAGQSSNAFTEHAVREAAGQAMSRAGIGRADLVVAFFTVGHVGSHEKLVTTLRDITGTDRIVGCSGAGVLSGEGEIEGEEGIAVAVLSSDTIRSRSFLLHPLRNREGEVGEELARAAKAESERNPLLVLFPDAYNGRPDSILQGLVERHGFFPAVGAGCSENGTQGKTFQLAGDRITTNALSGLLLTGSLDATIGITQGCQPVSGPMVITKARDNLILEINDRPAFEAFARVIKGPLLEDLRRSLAFVFVGLPSDPGRNSVGPGEYLVRNIVGLDPGKGVLAVGETVYEGERLIFTMREAQRAREDLEQMLQRTVQSLGGRRPQLGFYFNCCARGSSLYGMSGIDTAYIRRALGDMPLVGFFGSFELGPQGAKNHLLAYTGVLVLISEKEAEQ